MTMTNAPNPEVVARSLRALSHALTTSGVCAVEESGSRPVLDLYSTSPSLARGYELLIVHETASAGPRSAAHNFEWVIERMGGVTKFAPKGRSAEARASTERAAVVDTASDVAWLRHDLEIGMGEIASLFGVTRKAVYDWTNGAKATNAHYIKAVRSLIERELPAGSRPYLRQFWDFDPSGGDPLVSILKSGDAKRLDDASRALRALARPIADYVEQIRANVGDAAGPHVHNHDEYRNL